MYMSSMGGGITRFLCFLVFLCLVSKGSSERRTCPPSVLKIDQIPTGKQIETKTEWKVNITNTCACTILELTLLSPNFQSLTKIDPSIIYKYDSSHLLVNNGKPLYAFTSLNFTYAWDRLHFAPFDYTEACS